MLRFRVLRLLPQVVECLARKVVLRAPLSKVALTNFR